MGVRVQDKDEGHTIASQVDTGKGGKGRKEEREGAKEEGKSENLKKIVLPDDSFVVRQIFPSSRATCRSCRPSLVTECCHSGWGRRHPRRPGLASEVHGKSPLLVAARVLPLDTCSHVCSCKQHVCPQFI